MTHPMYISGCHRVTLHPMLSQVIDNVLIGQTIDDLSYVYKQLPLSNPPF